MPKQPKCPYPVVLIVWDDAETDGGWEGVPDKLEPSLAISVGFLVKETPKHILLAGGIDLENNHTNARQKIPRAMVKNEWILKK